MIGDTAVSPGGGGFDGLETPCLLLDADILQANVDRMRRHIDGLGVTLRPHLKTAKSLAVARRAMAGPAGPATVSTLREAEYFAEGGVRDMIYAVGVAPQKLDRVGAIRQRWGRIWRSSWIRQPRPRLWRPGAGAAAMPCRC